MGLEDLEEPVIDLVREEPLDREREHKIVKLLKKLGGKATISVLEIKLGVWVYDCLEGMVIKGLIKVR
jgi:hypothetical protein